MSVFAEAKILKAEGAQSTLQIRQQAINFASPAHFREFGKPITCNVANLRYYMPAIARFGQAGA